MSYDAKAVKVHKSVKRAAAQIIDPHQRGAFIKSWVKVLEGENNNRGARRDRKDAK